MSLISDFFQVTPLARARQKLIISEEKREHLEKKVSEMEAQERVFQARITSLQQQNLQLKEALQRFTGAELDRTDIAILMAISEYEQLSSGDLEELLRLSHPDVEFHLHKLVANSYLNPPRRADAWKTYILHQKGRGFLVENNME